MSLGPGGLNLLGMCTEFVRYLRGDLRARERVATSSEYDGAWPSGTLSLVYFACLLLSLPWNDEND